MCYVKPRVNYILGKVPLWGPGYNTNGYIR